MNEGNFPLRVQSNLPRTRISQVANGTNHVHTRVNDDTGDRGSVPSNPLGGAVYYRNVRKIRISVNESTYRRHPLQGKLAGASTLPFQRYCRLSTGYRCHERSKYHHRASFPKDILDRKCAYLGELWNRCNVVFWVTNTLDKNGLRFLVNGRCKVLWVISVDKLDAYAKFLECHCGVSATKGLGGWTNSNL